MIVQINDGYIRPFNIDKTTYNEVVKPNVVNTLNHNGSISLVLENEKPIIEEPKPSLMLKAFNNTVSIVDYTTVDYVSRAIVNTKKLISDISDKILDSVASSTEVVN